MANKRVIVPEGLEKEVSIKMFRLFVKYMQAVQKHRINPDGDRKRIMMKWEALGVQFFCNPLIELKELNEDNE